MNRDAQNLNAVGYNKKIPLYSPVHSPPTELAQGKRTCLESNPRKTTIDSSYLHLALQEHRESPSEIYTKIQTQLYPQMRF
jgi:hypothetical protein